MSVEKASMGKELSGLFRTAETPAKMRIPSGLNLRSEGHAFSGPLIVPLRRPTFCSGVAHPALEKMGAVAPRLPSRRYCVTRWPSASVKSCTLERPRHWNCSRACRHGTAIPFFLCRSGAGSASGLFKVAQSGAQDIDIARAPLDIAGPAGAQPYVLGSGRSQQMGPGSKPTAARVRPNRDTLGAAAPSYIIR
jgi:hypothetical protein